MSINTAKPSDAGVMIGTEVEVILVTMDKEPELSGRSATGRFAEPTAYSFGVLPP
jgi:hypothetical protein